MAAPTIIDLRHVPAAHLRGEILARVRDLGRDDELRVLFGADPSLELRSVALSFGHGLVWRLTHDRAVGFVAVITREGALQSRDVVSMLIADHRRLDVLLAQATNALNAAETVAMETFVRCASALRRHVQFEDEVVSAALDSLPLDEAAMIMAREHAEIKQQLCATEEALQQGATGMNEAAILCGMLAGLMAKHEFREETLVFPRWQAALERCDAWAREELMRSARSALLR